MSNFCQYCGVPIRKNAKACNDKKCQLELRYDAHRRKSGTKNCPICKSEFIMKRRTQTTCGAHSCVSEMSLRTRKDKYTPDPDVMLKNIFLMASPLLPRDLYL